MKTLYTLGIGLLMPLFTTAQEVKFEISKFYFTTVEGQFSSVKSDIQIDTETLANSKIEGTVELSSIQTGEKERDQELQTQEWFHAEKFPTIEIALEQIKKEGDLYAATAQVQIRGVKKQIPITFSVKNNRFKSNFSLDRHDFGIAGSGASMVVGDEVDIFLNIPINR